MSRRGWILFGLMCVIWGVPYLMIRIAVRELTPATVVFGRTALAALLLLPIAARRGELRAALSRPAPLIAFAVVEMAIPWLAVASAETKLSSSLTGLLIAAVPLVGAAITTFTGDDDRLNRRRLGGLLLGLVGVGLIVGLDIGGTSLGQAVWSSFDIGPYKFYNNEDGAWVQTYTGWTPQSKINGYSSGTLTVSGTWEGTLEAPVGTTACRYGENSGGPHCAAISARNVNICLSNCGGLGQINVNGLIKVNGVCTNDGDSGGPLVTASNQIQGTVTAGTHNSCPDDSSDYVYFQPITTTLSRANSALGTVAMLTSHGRAAPTFSVTTCPDPGSASGHFICFVGAYDSQGETEPPSLS